MVSLSTTSTTVFIKADNLFDPAKGFIEGCSVFVKDGVIARITTGTGHAAIVPDDSQVLDFTGYTISPPFCDHHLHFLNNKLEMIEGISSQLAGNGILKVFEAGDAHLSGFEAKRMLDGKLDVKTSGSAIYKKGCYGGFLGNGIESAAEAKPLIDGLASRGVDFIKVINSGIFVPRTGAITKGCFEREELAQIIGYANEKGLPVTCHANGDQAIRAAVEAGASTIVHGFYASNSTLALMAKKNVSFIPTINALFSLIKIDEHPEADYTTRKLTHIHSITTRRAKEMGVIVLPGSDSAPDFIPYGTAYVEELQCLRQAGLKQDEVLSCAVTGPLAEGGKADFLIIDGLRPHKVVINGSLTT